MPRPHPRLVVALIRHHYRDWRARGDQLPPGGRIEPAWYPDLPVSGSRGASYEPSRMRRPRWWRRS